MSVRKKILIVIGLLVLLPLITWQLLKTAAEQEQPQILSNYRQAKYGQYAGLIQQLVTQNQVQPDLGLATVRGGVAPHHLPTLLPVLTDFYQSLKRTRSVETFVIIGPNHVDDCRGEICVSQAVWDMPFSRLKPNQEVIDQLKQTGLVVNHEAPFYHEHSIEAQTLLISRLFPEARIVPLIIRSSLSNDQAWEFGKILAPLLNDSTFVVASVDFSHYLPTGQARPIDELSAGVLGSIKGSLAGLVKADSVQSLSALVSAMEQLKVQDTSELKIFNTADFDFNNDDTTGYVSGFWGMKK